MTELELNAGAFLILESGKNKGYLQQTLPSARDVQIRELLLTVGIQGASGKITGLLPPGASRVLDVFAERSASIAVRHQDPIQLQVGLLAAIIAHSLTKDEREVLPRFSMLYRAAEMIGKDPDLEFRKMNENLGGAALVLTEFLQRSPIDKSVQEMGFEEGDDADGFKFLSTW